MADLSITIGNTVFFVTELTQAGWDSAGWDTFAWDGTLSPTATNDIPSVYLYDKAGNAYVQPTPVTNVVGETITTWTQV
jgi:hypothetical protein